jgi:RHS repeat-associated protein
LGGYDNEFFHYSFTGQVLKKCYVHKTSYIASELTENYRFTYDKADRITGEYHQLNTQPEIALATMTYDDLGRMTRKILHGGGEAIDYTYNIRNWTKSITSPRFSETMYYQDALDGKPVCYNGNISAVKWGQGSTQEQKYYYTYDGLNRMKKATYWPDETYNEEITQYDKNGNILGLNRNGYVRGWDNEFPVFTGPIDEISFEYNGNQMRNAWDNLDDQDILNTTTNDFRDIYVEGVNEKYLYDANGNQYADLNKGIAWIQYNSLNLPSKMQFSNGNKNEYLYDASGVKHKATYSYAVNPMQIPLGQTTIENNGTNLTQSSYTDYCGNYVYEDGKIKRILTPEGYIEAAGIIPMNYIGYWTYNYLLKDHLGNTRMCLSSNYISAKSTILNNYGGSTSTIDYYPFGMEMERIGIHYGPLYAYGYLPGWVTPYLYNGKEMDRMNGLNEYDYGARWRDPTLGNGWNTVDPLAEKYYSISPYAYCAGNPVKYIDPNGKEKVLAVTGDKDIKKLADSFKDEKKVINIWAHGDSKGFRAMYQNGKTKDITNAKDFDKFLNDNFSTWRDKGNDEQVTIVLHSCSTGNEDEGQNSFARQMSKDLENTTIIAPSEDIKVDEVTTTDDKGKTTTELREDIKDDKGNKGQWVEFKGGKLKETYESGSKPGSEGF